MSVEHAQQTEWPEPHHHAQPRQELSLRGGPAAPAAARAAVDALNDVLSGSAHDDLRLLVSEIVGNAVRHAGMTRRTAVELVLAVEPGRFARIEITDKGPGFEPHVEHGREGGGGWGLFLLDQLADRWGVEGSRRGSRVWFELDLAEAA